MCACGAEGKITGHVLLRCKFYNVAFASVIVLYSLHYKHMSFMNVEFFKLYMFFI